MAKPFVKWAGGKTQIIKELEKNFNNLNITNKTTYIEPFIGGGAVLFWILEKYPNITEIIINDKNKALIICYQIIKNNVNELITKLLDLENKYLSLNIDKQKEMFYQKRKEFNLINNKTNSNILNIELTSLFIFLNKTCFNGLYRVNSKGEFNVPIGKYKNPHICDIENLKDVSEKLKKVKIFCGNYENLKLYANENTIYYLDPPYAPINKTSFTSYTADKFGLNEQKLLKEFCDYISLHKSHFICSNSDNNDIKKLYSEYNIKIINALRSINSNGTNRNKVNELIIYN